jgi:HK97 family phage major capsid protein
VDGGFNTLTSLPKWKALKFGGHKLISLSIVTNELMADVTMLGSHLKKAFAAEFGFLIDQAIVSGTGAGVPLGILNSAALIKVAKQSGQAAGTILAENVRDMWARMPLASRRNAVWLVSEDAMSQLDSPDASGFTGIFQPSGVASSAVPLLKGRPVLEIEQASALGTVGDIILVDPTQYITVSNKLRADFSVDFQFNNDQSVFRFTWRIDGKPASSSPITPFNGTVTRSPFVALAAR